LAEPHVPTNEKPARKLAGWLRTVRAFQVNAGAIAATVVASSISHDSAHDADAPPDHPESRRKAGSDADCRDISG